MLLHFCCTAYPKNLCERKASEESCVIAKVGTALVASIIPEANRTEGQDGTFDVISTLQMADTTTSMSKTPLVPRLPHHRGAPTKRDSYHAHSRSNLSTTLLEHERPS